MQRVRMFLVVRDVVSQGALRRLEASARVTENVESLNGWHQSWDFATRMVNENPGTEVVIADSQSLQVLSIFSRQNFECTERNGKVVTRWKSSVLHCKVEGYWCNLNCSDFGWGWVSGSEREVPFRLRYFERRAEAYPNGIVARAHALAAELRDWLYGPIKRND